MNDTSFKPETSEDHIAEVSLLPEEAPSLEQQVSDMRENWLRALADAENLRRRSQKEREDAYKYGAVSFARDIVGVADNMDRALQNCPHDNGLPGNVQALITGVEMISKEISTIFERHHIQKISPLGERFDPNRHQAMFEVETTEYAPGMVVQVLQDGYILHDRLLRAAMVGVSKAPLQGS
jgi:molecular chaperone GrpE